MSKLEIISKPAGQVVAHKIKFLDGQPVGKSTPCAGKNGTIIRAQDLYYNMKTRRETMTSGDEQNRIGEIIRSYAVHYHRIAFTLFKLDGSVNQIRTAGNIDKEMFTKTKNCYIMFHIHGMVHLSSNSFASSKAYK